MESFKKQRCENWTPDEKKLLSQLIEDSAHVIENKSTKTNINIEKIKEWKNITKKFNKMTGKTRSIIQVRLAWKRMKMTAKANLSHRKQQCWTGGEKPPSPSPKDILFMSIAPHDFVIDCDDYDSDAEKPVQEIPTKSNINEVAVKIEPRTQTKSGTSKILPNRHKNKKLPQNTTYNIRKTIADSNRGFKKRHLQMLELEHKYNIKIAQLKVKKLELEIELLESKKNV